jgi:hypothetical protein
MIIMSDEMEQKTTLPALLSDEDDRVIQGTLIKNTDGRWLDRDGNTLQQLRLLALKSCTIIQRWQDKKPVATIFQQPGHSLPDVDDLNAEIPQSEWELGVDDQPRPPWQLQRVLYLLNEETAERYTYASGTIGGRIAVDALSTRIRDMRALRGSAVVPVVELACKPMKTRFGSKQRPEFSIVGWRELAGFAAPQQLPSGIRPIEPPTAKSSTTTSDSKAVDCGAASAPLLPTIHH